MFDVVTCVQTITCDRVLYIIIMESKYALYCTTKVRACFTAAILGSQLSVVSYTEHMTHYTGITKEYANTLPVTLALLGADNKYHTGHSVGTILFTPCVSHMQCRLSYYAPYCIVLLSRESNLTLFNHIVL